MIDSPEPALHYESYYGGIGCVVELAPLQIVELLFPLRFDGDKDAFFVGRHWITPFSALLRNTAA